jgi:hypothetical protein
MWFVAVKPDHLDFADTKFRNSSLQLIRRHPGIQPKRVILPLVVPDYDLVDSHGNTGLIASRFDQNGMVAHVGGENWPWSAKGAPLSPEPSFVDSFRGRVNNTTVEAFRAGLNYLLFKPTEQVIAGRALATKPHVIAEFAQGRRNNVIAISSGWVEFARAINTLLEVH